MNLPYIWTRSQMGGSYIDLASYLLGHRTIFIGPELSSEMASLVVMQLLALRHEKGPVHIYINCYGGSVPAGLAIIDVMNSFITSGITVHTYCFGECMGISTAILVSGSEKERKAFKSSRISLYQEWHGVESMMGARIQADNERERLMQPIKEIFTKRTNPEKLTREILDGFFVEFAFIDASMAKELGIVDELC